MQIYDILYIVLSLIGLIVGRAAAKFFGKRSSVAERDGLLTTLEKLADMAIHEVEQWAKGDEGPKKSLKGEDKKKEAVRLLIDLLQEAVPREELKHLPVNEESKLLRAAVERKVQEKKERSA